MLYRKASSTLRSRLGDTDTRRLGISKLLTAIKESTRAKDLQRAKKIHAEAVESGNDADSVVISSLISMFAKCGSLEDARKIFDKSTRRDVFSWTGLLSGYVEAGDAESALEFFSRMQSSECRPNAYTFAAALKACSIMATKEVGKVIVEGKVSKLAALDQSMDLHRQAAKSSCIDRVVGNTLVDLYGKCGSLLDARMVFDRMIDHDVVSWTSIVWAYAQNDEFDSAVELFLSMTGRRCIPNARSFVVALKACCGISANLDSRQSGLESGRRIHSLATELKLDYDAAVLSSLIEMYFKCGSPDDAKLLFDGSSTRDAGAWNAMLLGYAQNGDEDAAFLLFDRMQADGIVPTSQTFLAALKACINTLAGNEAVDSKVLGLARCSRIHAAAEKNGFAADKLVASSLIDIYSRCGEMREARRIFDRLQHRDVVVWTSLILGYTRDAQPGLALQLYEQMLDSRECSPDSQCYAAALKACSRLATKDESLKALSLEKGLRIGSEAARSGCESDAFVAATLIEVFCKCGDLQNARGVFNKLQMPDAASWTFFISGYAQIGSIETAIEEFYRMHLQGCLPSTQTYIAALKACSSLAMDGFGFREQIKLVDAKALALKKARSLQCQAAASGFLHDVYVASTLVDLYAKCGSMADALEIFPIARDNVVARTSLILGYVANSDSETALEIFAEMQYRADYRADSQILAAALKACGDVAAVETGKQIHGSILRNGFETGAEIANALVDLYGKSGMMSDAQYLFDSIASNRSIETWTALMGGYSRIGEADLVFVVLRELQDCGIEPDGMTFTYVLAACSHAGLIRRGIECFEMMRFRYRLKPELEHYHGMVDLLGRANRLEEALEMVTSMPMEPTTVTWMTLLSCCKKWNNVGIGKVAFDSLRSIDDRHAAAHVVMGNIYAAAGDINVLN